MHWLRIATAVMELINAVMIVAILFALLVLETQYR